MASRNLRRLSLGLVALGVVSLVLTIWGARLTISEMVMVSGSVLAPWIVAAVVAYVGSALLRARETDRREADH